VSKEGRELEREQGRKRTREGARKEGNENSKVSKKGRKGTRK
jgi:hypothetical protein